MPQVIATPPVTGLQLALGKGGVGQVCVFAGPGDPSAIIDDSDRPNPTTAAVGSLFLRIDGGAGTTLYVREPSGWTAK